MRSLSTRELATLAYERGQEFDPAEMPASGVLDALMLAGRAGAIVPAPSSHERRRRARWASGKTPASPTAPWPPTGAYGGPINQLASRDRLLERNATPPGEQAQEESR
jgi:hypothetical protein